VGREGEILRRQLASFEARHPGTTVEIRAVPDAADQQHQLYEQWWNSRAVDSVRTSGRLLRSSQAAPGDL
jgi:hypothetical protein